MTSTVVLTNEYLSLEQVPVAALGAPHTWLSTAEIVQLARWTSPARRQQWLAGRWLAKRLVERAGGPVELRTIQISSHDARGLGVQPQITVAGQPLCWSLSLSHTKQGSLAALTTGATRVGVDLVEIAGCPAARSGFQQLWFSAAERAWAGTDPSRAARIWGIKEAAYKAVNCGEPWQPRQIAVEPLPGDRFRISYNGRPLTPTSFHAQVLDGQVLIVVCLPRIPADVPIATNQSSPVRLAHRLTDSGPTRVVAA
jgi:phosphopantetheinyl transferase